MSKTALIIIGVICIIILIIMIAAIIPKLKAAVSKTPLWLYLLLIILVIGALAFVGVQLFGPKGQDSLFSQSVEGSEAGDAQEDTPMNEKSDGTGTHFNMAKALEGNMNGDSTVHITVSADKISIGRTEFGSVDEFRQAADILASETEGHKVRLEDNYALASTYHEVRDYLDESGIEYSEKQID